MEPRKDEQTSNESQPEAKEEKPRRFRLVKLEERIAPTAFHSYNGTCHCHGNYTNGNCLK